MTFLIILVAIIAVPALLLIILKANGGVAFLALCLGSILTVAIGPDVSELLASFSPGNRLVIEQWSTTVLLLLPFIVTLLLTRGNVRGGPKMVTNIIVSVAAGALLAVLVIPLLPSDVQRELKSQELWQQVNSLYTGIIIIGAVTSMAMLVRSHRPHVDGKKHKD